MVTMVAIVMVPVVCLIGVCLFKLIESTVIRRDAVEGRDSAENFLRLDAMIQAIQVSPFGIQPLR